MTLKRTPDLALVSAFVDMGGSSCKSRKGPPREKFGNPLQGTEDLHQEPLKTHRRLPAFRKSHLGIRVD